MAHPALCATLLFVASAPSAAAAPATGIGSGLGTNVWYGWAVHAAPGEAAMLAQAYKVIRSDILWSTVEQAPNCGTYSFSHYYDVHLALVKSVGLTPLWIVDYSNTCYGPGEHLACNTTKCIAAFANYAAAIVERYKGNGIIFECMNEPDGMGNDPPETIAALCAAAGAHFAAAGETWVGPAVSNLAYWDIKGVPGGGLQYLNDSFRAGLLGSVSAVSVHPYNNNAPEGALHDYPRARALMAAFGAPPAMPLVESEWGWTTTVGGANGCWGRAVSRQTQGKFLARQWLVNLMSDVGITINYDWQDGGAGIADCESNYGSVTGNATGNASQPFPPKPKYAAALAAQAALGGAESFLARIPVQPVTASTAAAGAPAAVDPRSVFVLAFGGPSAGGASSLAAWTNITTCAAPAPGARMPCGPDPAGDAPEAACIAAGCCYDANTTASCYAGTAPTAVTVPLPAPLPSGACFAVTDTFGNALPSLCAAGGMLALNITDGPQYIVYTGVVAPAFMAAVAATRSAE